MLERIALFLMALLIGMLAWQDWSRAEEQTPIPVQMTKQERQLFMAMCDRAVWADRINFTGTCEQMKRKFDQAEKDAIKSKPDDAPKN